MNLIFIGLLLLCQPLFLEGVSLDCTEITVTTRHHSVPSQNAFPNVDISLKLSLSQIQNISYLQVSDFHGYDFTDNATIKNLCYRGHQKCINYTSPINTFILDSTDPLVEFVVDLVSGQGSFEQPVYKGFYNNGFISDADGNLFDEDNICNTVVDKGDPQYYYLYNQTSCCTSFSLATTAPNSPPCKAFKSRTTIYNPDFSIFATAFLNLTLNNGQLSTVGGYTFNNGSAQLRYYDGYNNICDTYGNSQLKCTIGVSTDRDHRYFIAAEFVTNSDVFPIADVASFLRDCGQTLMKENVPFTAANNCMYSSEPVAYHSSLKSSSEFCCKEFSN